MPLEIIAIDWSGAKNDGEARKKIWVAVCSVPGQLAVLENGRNREEVRDWLLERVKENSELVVGLDFAFSAPEWFIHERGCASAPLFWDIVAREGEEWLARCDRPFWGRSGKKKHGVSEHFRHTEQSVRLAGAPAKSFFQIGGSGAVGTGSLRGIPILRELQAGFTIWPFDHATGKRPIRTVIEIYPRLFYGSVKRENPDECWRYLTKNYPNLESKMCIKAASCDDAFDAAVSALEMFKHADELRNLPVRDGQILLEGEIWRPRVAKQQSTIDARSRFPHNSTSSNTTMTMTTPLKEKRVAVLGAGKMAGILLRAMLKQKLLAPEQVCATVGHEEKAQGLAKELGVQATTDNLAAARGADVILLGVKPQVMGGVLEQIRSELGPAKLLVSIAASVNTEYIEKIVGLQVPVVRAMPNTPCSVGSGMTGLCKGRFATQEHLDTARAMFDAVGKTVIVDEKYMDAVTGLSASGPAFAYIILESLAEGGVKVGLPRDVATLLAAQMMMGAARVVLETGVHPAQLKDAVTTPAGCTIDGILELEEGGLRVTLIKAVVKATHRAKELLFEG